jgi:hypothetical protein
MLYSNNELMFNMDNFMEKVEEICSENSLTLRRISAIPSLGNT